MTWHPEEDVFRDAIYHKYSHHPLLMMKKTHSMFSVSVSQNSSRDIEKRHEEQEEWCFCSINILSPVDIILLHWNSRLCFLGFFVPSSCLSSGDLIILWNESITTSNTAVSVFNSRIEQSVSRIIIPLLLLTRESRKKSDAPSLYERGELVSQQYLPVTIKIMQMTDFIVKH